MPPLSARLFHPLTVRKSPPLLHSGRPMPAPGPIRPHTQSRVSIFASPFPLAASCKLSAVIRSSVSAFNFKLSTLNPVTFLDAASTISPLFGTLTKKHLGVGSHPSSQSSRAYRAPTPPLSSRATRPKVPTTSEKICFFLSSCSRYFPPSLITDHGTPATRLSPSVTKSFTMRTSEKHARNSFRMRSFKTKDLKLFRMNSSEKTPGG